LGRPANLIVAREPAPIVLADRRLAVLPAPLTARRTVDDLSAWMDSCETPAAMLRVGLAHGAVEGRLPDGVDAGNPIAADRAARARLHYLALGDWHGTLQIGPRCWYAGTPEPDRFPTNDPGNVLLVELEHGREPMVARLRTATHRWLTLAPATVDEPGIEAALAAVAEPAKALVPLRLAGPVGLGQRAAIDAVCRRWAARLCHLVVDDAGLVVVPDEADLRQLDDGGPVGTVARRLAERAADGDGEAAAALRLLQAELARMPVA
jgi:hypothetical protein